MLKVISRSTFDLQTVLDTLVQSAARLCEADSAAIHRPRGDAYPYVASYGYSAEYDQYMRDHPMKPSRGSVLWRTAQQGRIVHVADVQTDPDFADSDLAEQRRIGGAVTVLGVPLLREGMPIGVIILSRFQVRPFTDKQIELVTTFADQAVIAIENVRLFDEVQARTRELQESLEYQTATSDVLNVISRSPFELQPVLDAIVRTASGLLSRVRVSSRGAEDGRCIWLPPTTSSWRHDQIHRGAPMPMNRGRCSAACDRAADHSRRRTFSPTPNSPSGCAGDRRLSHGARRPAAARRTRARRHHDLTRTEVVRSPTSRSSSSRLSPTRR